MFLNTYGEWPLYSRADNTMLKESPDISFRSI